MRPAGLNQSAARAVINAFQRQIRVSQRIGSRPQRARRMHPHDDPTALVGCFGNLRTAISPNPEQLCAGLWWSVLGCAVLICFPLTPTLRGGHAETEASETNDIRTILRLTHEQGLSVREISEPLKISSASIRMRFALIVAHQSRD